MIYDRRPDDMERITTPELAKAFIDEQTPESKERIQRILGLIETKNPGKVAEMIHEEKEMSSVFMDILKPQIDKKIIEKTRNTKIPTLYESDNDAMIPPLKMCSNAATGWIKGAVGPSEYKTPPTAIPTKSEL